MRLLMISLLLAQVSMAHAALTITDKDKLASVTLHTELINSSKRVYLAADFEATHKAGLIACEVTVEHKNGKEAGPSYTLKEDTSLMPNEKIPFNLGLFPESFHASGLDVKAKLECRKVTFFDKKTTKPLLKGTDQTPRYCCRYNALRIICASQPEGEDIIVNATEFNHPLASGAIGDYSPCYPVP
jgi:hypothetical protein